MPDALCPGDFTKGTAEELTSFVRLQIDWHLGSGLQHILAGLVHLLIPLASQSPHPGESGEGINATEQAMHHPPPAHPPGHAVETVEANGVCSSSPLTLQPHPKSSGLWRVCQSLVEVHKIPLWVS